VASSRRTQELRLSCEEILADYPFLEKEDILAAIEYAARQADHAVLASM